MFILTVDSREPTNLYWFFHNDYFGEDSVKFRIRHAPSGRVSGQILNKFSSGIHQTLMFIS